MTENKESLGQLKETLSPQAKALVSAMEEVYKNHKNLGESGKKKEKLNQFGDMAMTGDVGAEKMTLNSALGYSTESGKVIEFRGEESGNGLITNGEVQYWKKEDKSQESGVIDEFWVMDGIDGSENYANKTEWPYGTMVAIANKADPNYEDFTNAGVTMEEEGWVVLATRDSQKPGVYVIDLNNGNVSRLPNFNQENIFNHDNILADNYFT
jgi:fructose-1,6-bisphosphatase/inositol monophosphatase family enzyme